MVVRPAIIAVIGVLFLQAAAAPAVQVTVEADPVLTVGEPVVLRYRFENRGNTPLGILVAGYENDFFRLSVAMPTGATKVQQPWSSGGLRVPMYPLGVGKSFQRSLVLNQWFDFSMVGQYRLQVLYAGSVKAGEGQTPAGPEVAVPRIPDMTVSIRPRNEQALRLRCAELTERILGPTPFPSERREAAEALSFVADPVAVEFLARVAEAKTGEQSIALDGLVRIGGREGRQALLLLAKNPDPDLAQAANRALARIK